MKLPDKTMNLLFEAHNICKAATGLSNGTGGFFCKSDLEIEMVP